MYLYINSDILISSMTKIFLGNNVIFVTHLFIITCSHKIKL